MHKCENMRICFQRCRKNKKMRIALAQMRNSGDMRENLEKSIEMIREAADHHADLVLFPEVQLTEFFPQYEGKDAVRYRLTIDSEEVQKFQEVSRESSIFFGAEYLFKIECITIVCYCPFKKRC